MKYIAILNNIPSDYRSDLFLELNKEYKKLGYKFKVFYLSNTETVRNWKVSLQQYEFILPKFIRIRNFLTPTSDFILNYRYLNKLLEPDKLIIFGYNYLTYLIVAFIRKLNLKENILYCDTTLNDSRNHKLKIFIKSIIVRTLFDKYLIPGKNSKHYLNKLNINSSIFYAPQYSPLRPVKKKKILVKNRNNIKLIYVGRLSIEKKILEFLKIFHELKPKKFSITIIGNGPLKKDINEIAKKGKNISCLGYIEDKTKLKKIYEEHDVLVLVSQSEPWGIVVNEAINHGLALLLSPNVGSGPDLLKNNGKLINIIDKKNINNVLTDIYTNLSSMKMKSKEISLNFTKKQQVDGFIQCTF